MPRRHKKALLNFNECRTEKYGLLEEVCTACGLVETKRGACRNRACPKCNNSRTEEWIEDAKRRLPNIPYFHMVFTVPSELHYIARKNQSVFYDKLMRAVGETLVAFGESPEFVQGKIGFMSVLHTWDSKLRFHPHVHVLMAGGFLNSAGTFVPIKKEAAFPTHAMSCRYKTVLLKSLREELDEKIPSSFWNLAWVVYCKKTFPGTNDVVSYVGRYIKRIGIGPSRILKVDNKGVVFKYRHRLNKKETEFREMRLDGEEFMRRYLQHILPKGFVRIRYYGLLHTYNSEALARIKSENGDGVEEKEELKKKECDECAVKRITIKEIRPWWFGLRKKGGKFYLYKEEMKTKTGIASNDGAPPHNKLLKPTALGRHGPCEGKDRAGNPSGLSVSRPSPSAVLAA